jgi:Restriction endonuclease S subunits
MPTTPVPAQRLKYAATINDEALSESTDADFELAYIDIGNVDSQGRVHDIVNYRFEDAPSRARRIVRDGDVIISTVRTYLQAIAPVENPPDNLIVSTGFAVVRPSHLLDHRFCKYALRANKFLWEVESRSTGVSYPAINASDLGDIKVSLPEISAQRLIANYLDRETARIDGLIAEKERMLALLDEKRAALISRVVTRGLDPNAPLKPSGQEWLGEIPEEWGLWRLKHLASEALSYGANEAALEDNPDWPRFVRITDIAADGSLRDETFKSLSPEIAAPFLLNDGDLLFARSGATVGKSFIYRPSWGVACFAGYLIRFRCDLRKALPDYLNLYAQSSAYWHQVSTGTIQATIQNFSAEKYADIVVPLPPMKAQEDIVSALTREQSRFDALTSQIRSSLTLMKERRAALITAAVTGQIPLEEMTG